MFRSGYCSHMHVECGVHARICSYWQPWSYYTCVCWRPWDCILMMMRKSKWELISLDKTDWCTNGWCCNTVLTQSYGRCNRTPQQSKSQVLSGIPAQACWNMVPLLPDKFFFHNQIICVIVWVYFLVLRWPCAADRMLKPKNQLFTERPFSYTF